MTRYDFKKGTKFLAPLEKSYLHLKTSNVLGSGDELDIRFIDAEDSYVSGIIIIFDSGIKYKLPKCSGKNKRSFDTNSIEQDENFWTIEKMGYRIVISCNGAKVLDLTISDGICGKTDYSPWGRTVTRVKFERNKRNKADMFYYLGA